MDKYVKIAQHYNIVKNAQVQLCVQNVIVFIMLTIMVHVQLVNLDAILVIIKILVNHVYLDIILIHLIFVQVAKLHALLAQELMDYHVILAFQHII